MKDMFSVEAVEFSSKTDLKTDEIQYSSASTQEEPLANLPSCGELERRIGQTLQKAYQQHLGHLPSRVSCHLFADKLSIWIEDSITPVESVLLSFNYSRAESIRPALDKALRQRFKTVIEKALGVSAIALISDTCYEQKCTGLMVVLSETPSVRNPESVPKTAASRNVSKRNGAQ